MIRRSGKGFVVLSEKGKKLSKVYGSRKAAIRRLQEIEYYKHKNK